MPPGPGGGEGFQGGGRRRPAARERQGNEEIRKFLNFYKRRNSLCVDLYLPAFFQKKPSYEDLVCVHCAVCRWDFSPSGN